METLTERIEVRVSRRLLELVRTEAQARNVSVGQLVRGAIEREVEADSQARVEAARALFSLEAPVADWPAIEAEIEAARGAPDEV